MLFPDENPTRFVDITKLLRSTFGNEVEFFDLSAVSRFRLQHDSQVADIRFGGDDLLMDDVDRKCPLLWLKPATSDEVQCDAYSLLIFSIC